MAVASLSRRSRQSRATSSASGISHSARFASPTKKESITDRIARYKKQATTMTHEQRGTDEALNKDSAANYEKWKDLRKKATHA